MATYLNIAQIIIAIALIALAVLQSRNSSLGRMFGGDSSIHRTRRGPEKMLFNATVILAVLFFVTAFASVMLSRGA
ncbi:MAG: preprotein translocase subunit SecG [Chloroflexi bacterium]|nr:preprotein translocase subunit SecG [Chloroflexota bacterium]